MNLWTVVFWNYTEETDRTASNTYSSVEESQKHIIFSELAHKTGKNGN